MKLVSSNSRIQRKGASNSIYVGFLQNVREIVDNFHYAFH